MPTTNMKNSIYGRKRFAANKEGFFGWSHSCVPFVICLLIVAVSAVNCRLVSKMLANSPVS